MCIEILTILINNITFDYIIMSQLRQDNALTRNLYIYILRLVEVSQILCIT